MDTPKTIQDILVQISRLQSRKAVYQTSLQHLKAYYMESDAGPPEMYVIREDGGRVTSEQLDASLAEMENLMELIDAEIEALQDFPVGGGAPPVADDAAMDDDIAEAVRKGKKGTGSGKPRTQSSGPS